MSISRVTKRVGRYGAAAIIAATTTLLMSSVALAGGSTSNATRSGASSSGDVSFSSPYDFRVGNLHLSDKSCDSSSVLVNVRVQTDFVKTIATKRSTSGCGSTVQLRDVTWHSSEGTVRKVWVEVCVDSIWTNECTGGNRIENPYA
jgi:hypothetical protein